ncbi:MAG: flagellar filament capping protein FliD [Alphaproteobacteria bacterium]|nr:flagellar filament capping protein FliD [Alphaproteobacteria bacterium]
MAAVTGSLTSDQITSLIQQASTAYQAPATALQAQEKPITTQISALSQVQNQLSGLQSALNSLSDVQSLSQRSVTTAPSGAVQATATNDAVAGTYALSNIVLAEPETLLSAGFTSASGGLGAGSLAIQVGSGAVVTVNIPAGEDNLSGVAQAINSANVGVQAAVLFDGSQYRLELTSTATGAANEFTVSGAGGVSSLSYGNGASGLSQLQAASDAQFTLNGVAITSGSNTVTGAETGLTFTLAASGSATITVSQDVSSLDQAAQGVVTALNSALSTINQYNSYTAASGAGPLLGDINVEILRSQLLDSISDSSATGLPAGSPYTSLASIGFTITSGGTVAFDDSAFQAAANANYTGVAALLGSVASATDGRVSVGSAAGVTPGQYALSVSENDAGGTVGMVNGEAANGTGGQLLVTGAGAASGLALDVAVGVTGSLGDVSVSQGLFGALSSVLSSALASGSGVGGEITNLNNSLTAMNQQIAALQAEAQQETATLTQQFGTTQATLAQLSTVSSFLSTYFQQASG